MCKEELEGVLEVFLEDFEDEDNSTESIISMMEDAVERFNTQFGTEFDPNETVMDYIEEKV